MRFYATLILLLFSALVLAQDVEPPWLLEARAERLVEMRDFGEAIRLLRQAEQQAPNRAETHLALGLVFKAVNDFTIAEEYFLDSLELQFESDVERLVAQYELADIYAVQRKLAEYERTLASILQAEQIDPLLLVPAEPDVTLAAQGLNRFLILFRSPETEATNARSQLGELLVGLGRYPEAAEVLSIAVLHGFTTIIDRALHTDPLYVFDGVPDLWTRSETDDQVQEYLESRTLYHDMYYLAAAYYGEGNAYSLDLWRVLSEIDQTSAWGQRARRQLINPRQEPLLVPTR